MGTGWCVASTVCAALITGCGGESDSPDAASDAAIDSLIVDAPPPVCTTVPALFDPVPGAVVDNGCSDMSNEGTWTFIWQRCGATNYHLYVIGPNSTIPNIDVYTQTDTLYVRSGFGFVTDQNRVGWTWKVQAEIQGTWQEWSEVRTFDVEPVDTDCP